MSKVSLIIFLLSGVFSNSLLALKAPPEIKAKPPIEVKALPINRPGPASFADIVEPLLPAVVNIATTSEVSRETYAPEFPEVPEDHPFYEFFKEFSQEHHHHKNKPKKSTALGSGFIISADGYVVTNNHVIEEADEITVVLSDKNGTKLKAKIIGRDPSTDLALLKVNPTQPLPFVEFGDSLKSRVGDWAIAIGNPFGLTSTVTIGIISSLSRDIAAMDAGVGAADRVPFFIQIDAPMNVGNSGGPTFDSNGKVIGVNTAILSPSGGSVGIGFAVPSSVAVDIINKLKHHGEVVRGWLGVKSQPLNDDIAESFNVSKDFGVLVSAIVKGSPAEKSGLKGGDIIVKFNDTDVKNSRHLGVLVGNAEVGKKAKLQIIRKGKQYILTVTIESAKNIDLDKAAPEQPMDRKKIEKTLGMQLQDITEADKVKLGSDAKGVLVTGVTSNSEAKSKGIVKGDIILQVDHVEVNSIKEVATLMDKINTDKKRVISLLVGRGLEERFVALSLKDKAD